ncbi:MAG: DUF4019 domain-containing protein [Tahibacter sp.]
MMRNVNLAGIFLLLALTGAQAAEPEEPTLPAMKSARAWLETIDNGKLEDAWNSATDALHAKTDLARWSSDVTKRRGTGTVKCRRGLDFELFSDPDHVDAIFVTQFVDGRVIGERVGVADDEHEVSHVISYKVTPAPKGQSAPCGP